VGRLSARDPAFAAALRQHVRSEVREEERSGRYSTWRIGGPATVLHAECAEDVGVALTFAAAAGVPWFALGLGSNLLLPDEGLDALVIRIGKHLDGVEQDGDRWTLGAGLPAPRAARVTATAGFAGLHIFVGVPGTVGGGVYMNAGCHGGEWGDVVERVTIVDGGGRDRVLARDEIPFAYRRSGLPEGVVVSATVRLEPVERGWLDDRMAAMYRWRHEGTPFNQPCCGSVFRNPGGPGRERGAGPPTAGQLIEGAGLKGARLGGAQVSPVHANYIVNAGAATAADVRALMERARDAVLGRFGVDLVPEVKIIAPDGTYLNPREG
jgi:UDP-N-acetylmuramate dehydrogenase